MITVFGQNIVLPPDLAFLGNKWFSFLLDVALWVLIALAVEYALSRVVKRVTRSTATDVDDVILGIVRKPIIGLIALYGLVRSLEVLQFRPTTMAYLHKGFRALVILVLTYLVWRVVFKELLLHYGRIYAEESESPIDDILLPFVNQLAPVIIVVLGGLFFLQSLGVNVAALAVIIGGASFILAFALQQSLDNLFSGISLVIDAPFKYGDVIVLADGKVCEVKRIGMRVTELYNTDEHSVIFMPNSIMANEMIVNITQPTPDLRVHITLSVANDPDDPNYARRVRAILQEVANANPYVLSDIPVKLEAMQARLERLEAGLAAGEYQAEYFEDDLAELRWGMEALSKEQVVIGVLQEVTDGLEALAIFCSTCERGGLDGAERKEIAERFAEVEERSQVLMDEMEAWTTVRKRDPNLFEEDSRDDTGKIDRDMARRRRLYEGKLRELGEKIRQPGEAEEQRLDDFLRDFRHWILSEFKELPQEWRWPDADFDNIGPWSLDFNFQMFVDDVQAERYERIGRVVSDLRRNVYERFTAEGIELPFPQQDVWFRSELQVAEQGTNVRLAPRATSD